MSERTRKRKPKAGGKRRRSDRRIPRPLWAILALAGLAAAATVMSSRRIDPLDDWDDLLDDGLGPRRRGAPYPSTPLRLPGPAGELYAEDGGEGGLPVVFVHGLGGTGRQWEAQLDHLRPVRRALAFDLRGHGRSEPPDSGAYGVGAYADDLAAVVDAMGLERYVVAGHSLGATVAVEHAARRPEEVAGLLLVDPNGDQTRIPRRELEPFLAALAGDPAGELRSYFKQILVGAEPEVADRVLADLDNAPPEAFVASLESSFAYSPVAALERYPGPRWSVISDLNSLPFSLHNLLPDLPVRLIGGTSHWLMMDRPEAFNAVLDELLAEILG